MEKKTSLQAVALTLQSFYETIKHLLRLLKSDDLLLHMHRNESFYHVNEEDFFVYRLMKHKSSDLGSKLVKFFKLLFIIFLNKQYISSNDYKSMNNNQRRKSYNKQNQINEFHILFH